MRKFITPVLVGALAAALAVLVPVHPAQAKKPVPATGKQPIVFVHGWNGSASNWGTMISRFRSDGYTSSQLFAWQYDTTQSNAVTAEKLAAYVDSVRAQTGATRVDVVTHSMGGLSSRHYLKNLGGQEEVDDWVSLGGPNHGTELASICSSASCLDMRIGSPFLTDLNSGDETPGAVSYGTFWSSCDEMINPDSSVLLSGAVNTHVGCVGHVALLSDTSTYRGVRDFVR